MESALTPREIQARIRGGESLDDVAQAAGVSVEQIDIYAGPVFAEREHAASIARTSQLRGHRDPGAQRLLGEIVTDALSAQGVKPEDIHWDSWRDENRRWTVQISWPVADTEQHATFDFDMRGRTVAAKNAEAKTLVGESPQPVKRRTKVNPDAEPTVDLHDELAIVRVVQDDSEPPAVLPDAPSTRITKLPARDQESGNDSDEPDDYADPELEQVDGVYDIVPNPRSDMDVLYDMLSGFNEDSVRIYTGLTQPVNPPPDPEPEEEPRPEAAGRNPQAEKPRPSDPRSRRRGHHVLWTPDSAEQAADDSSLDEQTPPVADHPGADASQPDAAASPGQAEAGQPQTDRPEAASEQATRQPRKSSPKMARKPAEQTEQPAEQPHHRSVADEAAQEKPEQDALVQTPKQQSASKSRKRRKRASVPTWDEIMFGSPPPSDPSTS